MSKNITIPFSTFEQIIELLDDIDAERYGCNFYNAYCEVLTKLKVKMQKIELRDAYAQIIQAKDEDEEFHARIEYLRLKRELSNLNISRFD